MKKLVLKIIGPIIILVMLGYGVFIIQYTENNVISSQSDPIYRPKLDSLNVKKIKHQSLTLESEAFGHIQTQQHFSVIADVDGKIDFVLPNLHNGMIIPKKTLIISINVDNIKAKYQQEKINLNQREEEYKNINNSITLLNEELNIAYEQRNLIRKALQRQQKLFNKQAVSKEKLDQEKLDLLSTEKSITNIKQNINSQQAELLKIKAEKEKIKIILAEYQTNIEKAKIYTPFEGMLIDFQNLVIGEKIIKNQTIGSIINHNLLDVNFYLPNQNILRIMDSAGRLIPLDVTVSLSLGDRSITSEGTIKNMLNANNQAGKQIIASLQNPSHLIRHGNFVKVNIIEPRLDHVAIVPSSAIDHNDNIFIVTHNNILKRQKVNIIRQINNDIVIDNLKEDTRYIPNYIDSLNEGTKIQATINE